MKKYIILFLVLICLIVLGFFLMKNKSIEKIFTKEPTSLCYLYSKKTDRNFYDKAYLRLNIAGEKVTGEFNSYLAEKDSKIGTFSGTVGTTDKKTTNRIASLWWDSFGEGMRVTEELLVEFGNTSASLLSGEMTDRGDGVYVYKDKTKTFQGLSFGQISCENLDEMNAVEKFVTDNIKTIATDKPVLGGSWHVLSAHADPILNTGDVMYEDGHVQSLAIFEYVFNGAQNILIKKFLVK